MIQLSREIRFALVSPEELERQLANPKQKNSWAAWPITDRIVPQLRLSAVVEGTPNSTTGYLCNVTLIDKALRAFVNTSLIPTLSKTSLGHLPSAPLVLQSAFEFLKQQTLENANPVSITLHLSPFLSYRTFFGEPNMIQLTHQFEFSAAHRLHCDSMSDEENIAIFGKCNNPAGHGHNYVVEVSVSKDTAESNDARVIGPTELAEIVNRNVIGPLDHKNLHEDIDYFSKINPSVENICVAVFDWLKSDIESTGCKLNEVKVFETPKTWASYCGQGCG